MGREASPDVAISCEAGKEANWFGVCDVVVGATYASIRNEQKNAGNIAAWADGIYLLQVYAIGPESFRVVKVSNPY